MCVNTPTAINYCLIVINNTFFEHDPMEHYALFTNRMTPRQS